MQGPPQLALKFPCSEFRLQFSTVSAVGGRGKRQAVGACAADAGAVNACCDVTHGTSVQNCAGSLVLCNALMDLPRLLIVNGFIGKR